MHVQYTEYENKVTFIYDNGALVTVKFDDVAGLNPIPVSKHSDIIDFIKVYHAHIVLKWMQFYVYKQKLRTEKITKKVKP